MNEEIQAFKTSVIEALKTLVGDLPIEGCLVKVRKVRIDRNEVWEEVLKIEVKAQVNTRLPIS